MSLLMLLKNGLKTKGACFRTCSPNTFQSFDIKIVPFDVQMFPVRRLISYEGVFDVQMFLLLGVEIKKIYIDVRLIIILLFLHPAHDVNRAVAFKI